jgi:prolyl-tRNA editing enzyme YbaK/EbsC (Cys-tRNA(Pro) deacylase)
VIYINAGQRGLLLGIAPGDAVKAGAMRVVDLCAE